MSPVLGMSTEGAGYAEGGGKDENDGEAEDGGEAEAEMMTNPPN